MTHWPDLEAALQGRPGWRRVGREYHGPCPVSGAGRDCCFASEGRASVSPSGSTGPLASYRRERSSAVASWRVSLHRDSGPTPYQGRVLSELYKKCSNESYGAVRVTEVDGPVSWQRYDQLSGSKPPCTSQALTG